MNFKETNFEITNFEEKLTLKKIAYVYEILYDDEKNKEILENKYNNINNERNNNFVKEYILKR